MRPSIRTQGFTVCDKHCLCSIVHVPDYCSVESATDLPSKCFAIRTLNQDVADKEGLCSDLLVKFGLVAIVLATSTRLGNLSFPEIQGDGSHIL